MSGLEDIRIKEIKLFLKKHKISQVWLAKESGYSAAQFSLVFSGHHRPSERFLRILIPILITKSQETSQELKQILRGTKWEQHVYGAG